MVLPLQGLDLSPQLQGSLHVFLQLLPLLLLPFFVKLQILPHPLQLVDLLLPLAHTVYVLLLLVLLHVPLVLPLQVLLVSLRLIALLIVHLLQRLFFLIQHVKFMLLESPLLLLLLELL